jgi:WD40 repeat protein
VRIWDPATGVARHTLTGHTGRVVTLAVAPDGSWLASADFGRKVRILDPITGAIRHALQANMVEALVVAPDGSWLASAGDGLKPRILDWTTGTPTGHDGEIRIWDPTTGAPLMSLRVAGRLFHLLLASTTIAAAGEHGPYFLALHPGIQSK